MSSSEGEWSVWWDARVSALESIFGKSENSVGHAPVPFELGADAGGAADVVYFKNKIPGVISVTSELIGRDDQVQNSLGNYELAICHRDAESWGPNLISRLAHYTLTSELSPGETMDIPRESNIAAFLFQEFGSFTVKGRTAGVLLCIGITADELKACRKGRREEVEEALKEHGVYPYTELNRKSVLPAKKSWWSR